MLVFAYIALLLCAAFCIGFTIYEHKRIKQKDIDTEIYNEHLQVTKKYLLQEVSDLEEKLQSLHTEGSSLFNSNQLLYEQGVELQNTINCLTEQKNELDEQVHTDCVIVENMRREHDYLKAQMGTLQSAIDTLSSSQRAAARASFEQYCEALEYEYQKAESEYDTLIQLLKLTYEEEQDFLVNALSYEKKKAQQDLDVIKQELEKIRATRAATMEAQLREEEIKTQATFYTLQLNEADKRDVTYLQSIEYNLREARPLRMLIWSTFYRDKVNELAARTGAIGASGIYKLTHIDSGISYIGQAKDIKERWITHVKCSLGIDTPVTNQLYAFTREKGIDNFTFEILEKCNVNELNEKEKFYIDLYQTYDFGLNKTRGNG